MPTITDVAQTAGVSKNTVSRYLNNRGYMSEKTKAAIQAAIEELHYQPQSDSAKFVHQQDESGWSGDS